jgi:hypothetical protein
MLSMGIGVRVLLFQDREKKTLVYFSRKWKIQAILYKRNNYGHFSALVE